MKKYLTFLLGCGFMFSSGFAVADNIVLCPAKIACKSSNPKSCKAITKTNSRIKWSVAPGPTASPILSGKYNLISAFTDKILTPGSCVYMTSQKNARSSFIVLVSDKNLRPLRNNKTDWQFQKVSWFCPKIVKYKKIDASICAFKLK